MGSQYPVLLPKQIIKALRKQGFRKVSQRGGHAKYRNDTNPVRTVIIPMHSEIT